MRQQADFIQLLQQRDYRRYCQGNRYFELRNQLVSRQAEADRRAKAEGRATVSLFPHGLQACQWKMCLQVASNTNERYWRLVQVSAAQTLRQRKLWLHLSEAERSYAISVLHQPGDRFFDLLDGETLSPTEGTLKKGGSISKPAQLCAWVRCIVHQVMGSLPVHGASRSVWFDTGCWTLKREADGAQRLKIMSLRPGKRLEMRLKGQGAVKGTLVLVRRNEGFFVHVLQKIKPKKQKLHIDAEPVPAGKLKAKAFDMGFTEVFTDDEGHQYDKNLGKIILAYATAQEQKLRERNRLATQARNTPDAKKRRRLLKFNLGTKQWEAERCHYQAQIESHVNMAFNQMMEAGKAAVFIVEAFGQAFRMEGISKKVRNRLSRWVRGLIDERLAFKAAVHQVQVAKVPAAYSSQACHVCSRAERDNRQSDRFKCLHCGFEGHADQVEALNLLARIHDPFYKRHTGKDAVRRHLRESYEEWCRRRNEVPRPPSAVKNRKSDTAE